MGDSNDTLFPFKHIMILGRIEEERLEAGKPGLRAEVEAFIRILEAGGSILPSKEEPESQPQSAEPYESTGKRVMRGLGQFEQTSPEIPRITPPPQNDED